MICVQCVCRSDACANVVATRTTPAHGVPLKCTRWLALAAGSAALTVTSADDNMLLCRRGCIQEAHRSLAFLTLRPAPFSLLISQEGVACGVQVVRGWRGCTCPVGTDTDQGSHFRVLSGALCCFSRPGQTVSRGRAPPLESCAVPLLCVNARAAIRAGYL
jgi:hypothetical protein